MSWKVVGEVGVGMHLELLLGGEAPFLNVALQATDGVLCAGHVLDLFTSTVGGTGVGHAIRTV
jgi:hypothetical protein